MDLPKKHGRGGQSALRFARLRNENRHNYLRKVSEKAVQFFISNDSPNVNGLILAGCADFKTELNQTEMFDRRLKKKIIKILDINHGDERGFNEAIDLAGPSLTNVKYLQQKQLLVRYFDEISQDSGTINWIFGFWKSAEKWVFSLFFNSPKAFGEF